MQEIIQIQFSLLDPAGRIMIWPAGLIIDFLAALIVTIKLYSSWKTNRSPVIGDLALSFGSFIFMWLFMWLPAVMRPDSSQAIGTAVVVAHSFAYLGLAFFGRMLMTLLAPKYKNVYFVAVALWGVILTVANIVFFSFPKLAEFTKGFSVTLLNPEGYFFWKIMPTIVVATWGLGGVYFLAKSLKRNFDSRQRIQSLILGIAFLALLAGGPLHMAVSTPSEYLALEIGFALAHFMVLWGVFYRGLPGPASD